MSVDVSVLLPVIGFLVAVVNVLTQVIKHATYEKMPTNILVLALSIVLTLVAFFAYVQIEGIIATWYMVVAAVVVGFFVAYAAMFGFDKFKEVMNWVNK